MSGVVTAAALLVIIASAINIHAARLNSRTANRLRDTPAPSLAGAPRWSTRGLPPQRRHQILDALEESLREREQALAVQERAFTERLQALPTLVAAVQSSGSGSSDVHQPAPSASSS